MDRVPHMDSHKCKIEENNHFLPAGYTNTITAQYAAGLLHCNFCSLLAHVHSVVYQGPQVLFHKMAFQPIDVKPGWKQDIFPDQGQDSTFTCAEPHDILAGLFLQPINVLLSNCLPSSERITPTQCGMTCKPARCTLYPTSQNCKNTGYYAEGTHQ